jgi:hypothetical protein
MWTKEQWVRFLSKHFDFPVSHSTNCIHPHHITLANALLNILQRGRGENKVKKADED